MDEPTILTIVLPAMIAVVFLISGVLLFWILRAQRRRLAVPPALGADGATSFPVRAIYTRAGIFGGASRNSMNPLLAVGAAGIDLRVLRRRHLDFGEIEHADARRTLTGEALVLRARGGRVFVMRFGDADHVRRILTLLPGHVPVTEEAAMLRDGNAAAATPGLARYHGPLG